MDYENIIKFLSELSIKAGELVMEIYNGEFEVDYKQDDTPFTIADKKCEELIIKHISQLTPDIPIYGEETFKNNFIPCEKFWLIDPIDGTKAFIKGDNLFTINIALIENNQPILGVVYEPQNDELYTGSPLGAFKNGNPIEFKNVEYDIVVANNFGASNPQRRQQFFEGVNVIDYLDLTSSIKICKVAEGLADLYPRIGHTYEWDTAAGHAILKQSGGNIITIDRQELIYGKENLLNPKFIFVYGDKKLIKLMDNINDTTTTF